jgi:hypothetical protein
MGLQTVRSHGFKASLPAPVKRGQQSPSSLVQHRISQQCFPIETRFQSPQITQPPKLNIVVSRNFQGAYQLHPLLMQEGSQKPSPTLDKSQLEEQPSSSIVRVLPLIRLSAPPSRSAELFRIICDKQKAGCQFSGQYNNAPSLLRSSVLVTCTNIKNVMSVCTYQAITEFYKYGSPRCDCTTPGRCRIPGHGSS